MRKIIVTEFVSLDGVMDTPAWTMPYWNEEISNFKEEEDQMTDALLLGRVTYEGFAAVWPTSEDEGAARMNSVRKYVVSTTLESAEWNNSVMIREHVIDEIKALKAQAGQDMLVYGSATLVQSLMQNDLVDLYRLLVYPVVLGTGKRLFQDGMTATLKLIETRTFTGGVVGLIYEPARD